MDLETLFATSAGFGVESATFLQRAICRITDGAPMDDLLARGTGFERDCLRAAIGCDPSVLPVSGPPLELCNFGPVRTGKSLGFAAIAVARARTIDVSIVRPGEEPPRISILATQLDQASAIRGHLNIVHERPKLRRWLIGDDADSITIRHPSGLPIEIRVIAASRGGYSLAARWAGTVIFDEAPGWGSTDRIVSLEDSRDQALTRVLPGGQVIYGGSVWQPSGWCFEADREHFGKPSPSMVVIRPRSVDNVTPAEQLNPAHWTPERIASVRRKAPRSFKMHILNEFGGASSVFDFDAVERSFRQLSKSRVRAAGRPFGIIDASSGKKDTWAYAVAQWIVPEPGASAYLREPAPGLPDGVLIVDDYGRPIVDPACAEAKPFLYFPIVGGFEGAFWDQISAEEVIARVAHTFTQAGVHDVHGDQREAYMLSAAFRQHGFSFHEHPYTASNKSEAVERVRRWLAASALIFHPHERLRSEFHQFVEKPTPGGGFTFGARGTGHDDYVALVLTTALADIAGQLRRSPVAPSHGRGGIPHEALG